MRFLAGGTGGHMFPAQALARGVARASAWSGSKLFNRHPPARRRLCRLGFTGRCFVSITRLSAADLFRAAVVWPREGSRLAFQASVNLARFSAARVSMVACRPRGRVVGFLAVIRLSRRLGPAWLCCACRA